MSDSSDRSVVRACRDNHRGGGGAIPARSLFVCYGLEEDAKELVKRFHYSRRWPASVQLVATFHVGGGLFGDRGPAVAACTFSIPPTRWSEPVFELSRLVRAEKSVALSKLISLASAEMKRRHAADLLVSFADNTQGHYGGVYKAAGWRLVGERAPQMTGVTVGGKFVPGRSCNTLWGTRSPERLAALGIDAEAVYDAGKVLYCKWLGRRGQAKAQRLGLLQEKAA